MVQLHQEPPAGAQHPADLGEHGPVLGVVEVPVGGEPAHHRVEGGPQGRAAYRPARSRPRRPALGVPAGQVEEQRRGVEPGGAGAPAASRLAMRPWPSRGRGRRCPGPARRDGPPGPPRRRRRPRSGWHRGTAGSPRRTAARWASPPPGPPLSRRRPGRSGARRRTGPPGPRVGQPAGLQRQAPAADAAVQPVAEALEQGDLLVQPGTPLATGGTSPPWWGCARRAATRGPADLLQAQADLLGHPDERHPAQHVAVVAALAAAERCDEISPSLVVAGAEGPPVRSLRAPMPSPCSMRATVPPKPPPAFRFTRGGRLWHGV